MPGWGMENFLSAVGPWGVTHPSPVLKIVCARQGNLAANASLLFERRES
jgi:hypothetical protein